MIAEMAKKHKMVTGMVNASAAAQDPEILPAPRLLVTVALSEFTGFGHINYVQYYVEYSGRS